MGWKDDRLSFLGTYTAIFQVSNSIDAANISCVVQVVPILQQVYYSLNPANWPLASAIPFQASVFIGDPNPGSVTITWDFGDGTVLSGSRTGTVHQNRKENRTRHLSDTCLLLATQYFQADTRSHNYSAVGTYTLTITVQGPMNMVVKSFPVQVQYPVSNFQVTTPSVAGSASQIAYTGSQYHVKRNDREIKSILCRSDHGHIQRHRYKFTTSIQCSSSCRLQRYQPVVHE